MLLKTTSWPIRPPAWCRLFLLPGPCLPCFPRIKYFVTSEKRPKLKTQAYISYPISVVAGLFLAVCSCTVLPLFAGIRQRGAGIGPAVAFLYTAPATNILAIIYTSELIGADLALARIILSVSFASIIGMVLAASFKEEAEKVLPNSPDPPVSAAVQINNEEDGKSHRFWAFFLILVASLLVGASSLIDWTTKGIILSALIAALLAIIIFWLPGED
ncbi:MAG: permease, partial [Deltaproteobacteria bacterium]|nr:permease [Deltaproteobacteria bacterium]